MPLFFSLKISNPVSELVVGVTIIYSHIAIVRDRVVVEVGDVKSVDTSATKKSSESVRTLPRRSGLRLVKAARG